MAIVAAGGGFDGVTYHRPQCALLRSSLLPVVCQVAVRGLCKRRYS